LRRGEVRVHVVAYLPEALSLRQEHHQPLDGWRERPRSRPPALREQGDQIGMSGEEVELRFESCAKTVERSAVPTAELRESLLELGCAGGEDRVEEPALGVEVVKQQLLVHAGPARDLIDASAVEPMAPELVAGRGDYP